MVVRRVAELGELSKAEERVRAGLDSGAFTELGDGSLPEAGDAGRRVRAGLIRLLLLGDDPDPKYRLHEQGLQIRGAWIPDLLDLEGCRDLRDVALMNCRFAEAPLLRSAGLGNLYLSGSRLPGLAADGLEARGDVFLRGVEAEGELRLLGAKLGGVLDCEGARLRAARDAEGKPGPALTADRLEARGGVFLRGVEAEGALRLPGAKLGGDLDCEGARLRAARDAEGKPGPALFADGLEARGGVFLRGVEAEGELRLLGAKLGGDLDCTGARLRAARDAEGKPGPALTADRLEASGVVLSGVEAEGELRLPGAKLGGDLDCTDARLRAARDAEGKPGPALTADGLEASGGVFLRGVEAEGELRLLGANLGGNLSCTGARLRAARDAEGKPGPALTADRLEASNVVLRGVEAEGELRLLGAKLGGDLDCEGARLRAAGDAGGKSGRALSADGARVSGSFFLRDGASVAGVLSLTAAELGSITDDPRCWPGVGDLLLDRCRYGAFTGRGPVDAEARLDWLARQVPARWGKEFWPQPYEQLARVLREMGHGAEARTVLVEKERLQRAARRAQWQARLDGARLRLRVEREGLAAVWPAILASRKRFGKSDPRHARIVGELRKSPEVRRLLDAGLGGGAHEPGATVDGVDRVSAARAPVWDYWWRLNLLRVWDGLVGWTIGYGRRPERAALWALGFLLFGAYLFAVAAGQGAIKPNTPVVLRAPEWVQCAPGGGRHAEGETQLACFLRQPEASGYPRFNAFVYSADTLLPIVSLEMQGFWIPDERSWPGWRARVYLWVHICLGWALSLLAVAGFSGLVKSD